MTDPKIEIAKFAAKEEQAAKAWMGSNWVPFGAGIALAELLNLIVRHF